MTIISKTLYTIGHSTHSLEYFIDELKSFDIGCVVDVRSLPGSNKYPQFNSQNLAVELPLQGIDYQRIEELGGRRRVHKDSPHTVWRNTSFRAYADHMDTPLFLKGIELLSQIASAKPTAIMCAEAVWWRCHRSMVADYMKSIGWEVIHITGVSKSTPHPFTSAASIIGGKLHYGNSDS